MSIDGMTKIVFHDAVMRPTIRRTMRGRLDDTAPVVKFVGHPLAKAKIKGDEPARLFPPDVGGNAYGLELAEKISWYPPILIPGISSLRIFRRVDQSFDARPCQPSVISGKIRPWSKFAPGWLDGFGRLPPAVTPAGTHAGKPWVHDHKGYQD